MSSTESVSPKVTVCLEQDSLMYRCNITHQAAEEDEEDVSDVPQ